MHQTDQPQSDDAPLGPDLGPGLWLIGAVSLLAALVGLPLYADGGFYFFKLATHQEPLLPNLRFSALIPQLPGWVATRWTTDPVLLRHVFSVSYQALPWLSLMACWLIVRRRAPWLMLLPLLGALVNLINFSAVSELLSSLYLTWPLILAMALSPERRWVQLYAFLAGPLLLALHPLTLGPLFATAAAALLLAWQLPQTIGTRWHNSRRIWGALGLWLAMFGLLRLTWTLLGANAYERSNLTSDGLPIYLLTETLSQHLLLGTVAAAGVLVAWMGWRGDAHNGKEMRRGLSVAVLGGLGALVLAASIGVAAEFLFGHGIKLKAGVIFVAELGLMGLAFLAARLRPGALRRSEHADASDVPPMPAPTSARFARLLVAAMVLLILAKSAAWWTATRNLQTVIASSDGACIQFAQELPYGLQWPWMQIIDDWATPMNALAFRPRVPTAEGDIEPIPILLPYDGCEVLAQTGVAHLTSWLSRDWTLLDQLFGPLRSPAIR